MKPREEDGVVDPRLNVYGTQCLKVAGASWNILRHDLI
jgi:alcohol oxidase